MVENGVRVEIKYLKDRIAKTKAYFANLENQVQVCKKQIEFFTAAQKYYKEVLEHVKGTSEERDAQESVKTTESWLDGYEKSLVKNKEAIETSKEVLKELEERLKELKE